MKLLLLFAGIHLVGGPILFGGLRRLVRWRRAGPEPAKLDFGWPLLWRQGPRLLAAALLAAAVLLQWLAPPWWPLALLLTLLAANAFAGALFAATASQADRPGLPMVDLFPLGGRRTLDGGCGAGRTSIALALAWPDIELVALDRFDAPYVAAGGRQLLDHNLRAAGVVGRVQVECGDLTRLPFADASFDGAVSAHAIDHLGAAAGLGLAELRRVLKPGRRLLLVVWVPGWSMFALINVLAFHLAAPTAWRERARQAGFDVVREGRFDGVWFLLLARPGEPATVT